MILEREKFCRVRCPLLPSSALEYQSCTVHSSYILFLIGQSPIYSGTSCVLEAALVVFYSLAKMYHDFLSRTSLFKIPLFYMPRRMEFLTHMLSVGPCPLWPAAKTHQDHPYASER
jgi:hypothetical protein